MGIEIRRLSLVCVVLVVVSACGSGSSSDAGSTRPNFVVILTDDQGYGDAGVFGSTRIATPNIDRLAREGIRLTSFYAAPLCSPARAMLLTGSYGQRLSVFSSYNPLSFHGLNPDEVTIAELLKGVGYATAIVGKWHLGHLPPFLPTRQGFDEYFGIPYSNDMGRVNAQGIPWPGLPLMEGEEVIEREPEQSLLTRRYTERAVDFIARNKHRPFFVYLAHSMPHWPIAASDRFVGQSRGGLYGDVIEEIDWSVGEILRALEEQGIDGRTLVFYASDNGPWLQFGNHAGSTGGLRGGKTTTFEGGVRVPAVAWWPGHIPAGSVSGEPIGLIDVLPTLTGLADIPVPERPVDGKDVWPVLSAGRASPHEAMYFYAGGGLEAVRSGRWKLVLPHRYSTVVKPGYDGAPGRLGTEQIGLSLFDLETDEGETTNMLEQDPEVAERLLDLAERARAELGDSLTGRVGVAVRPAGYIPPGG